jgi:hypothetical protein
VTHDTGDVRQVIERSNAEKYLDGIWALLPLGVQAHIMRLHSRGLDPVRIALRRAEAQRAELDRQLVSAGFNGDAPFEQRFKGAMEDVAKLRAEVNAYEDAICAIDKSGDRSGPESVTWLGKRLEASADWYQVVWELAEADPANVDGLVHQAKALMADVVAGVPPGNTPSGWQQRIAAIEPWRNDQQDDPYCMFCGVARYRYDTATQKLIACSHAAECVWQDAVNAFPSSGWQPIATALELPPGTRVVVWDVDAMVIAYCIEGGWFTEDGEQMQPEPTLWWPIDPPQGWQNAVDALPPAPEVKDADADDEALIDKGWEQLKAADIAAKGSSRDIVRGAFDPFAKDGDA